MRDTLGRICFLFAGMLFGLGMVMTFIPGSQAGWFGLTCVIAQFGMIAKNNSLRAASLALAIASAAFAVEGYWQGARHRERLRGPVEIKTP